MSLLDRIKLTLSSGLIGAAALISSSCDYELRLKEKYKGSPADAVREISTPKQAQDFIDKYIDYDDKRAAREYEVDAGYSLNLLISNGKGVCRDAVTGICALLADDGFPSYYLSISNGDGNDDGHAVYAYQRDGLWGSVGINPSDYHEPVYPSPEGLARKIASDRGFTFARFSIEDLSTVDTLNGVLDGVIPLKNFFVAKYINGVWSLNFGDALIKKTSSGWSKKITEVNNGLRRIIIEEYDNRLSLYKSDWLTSNVQTGEIVDKGNWRRTDVFDDYWAVTATVKNFLYTNGSLSSYNFNEFVYEFRRKVRSWILYNDSNGDMVIDYIIRRTYRGNGSTLVEVDEDADGYFDHIFIEQ
jgi:hypothetical protein